MDKKNSNLFLGSGALSWHSEERISDRYGSVFLFNYFHRNGHTQLLDLPLIKRLHGSLGTLKASIISTRTSTHVGDLFRGFKPITPKINEVILLGNGFLFYEVNQEIVSIGLRPAVPREADWLDPESLYRCHHQDVELYFQLEKDKS